MILKTTFNYFLKFFMEAVFTGKQNNKGPFFLTIDTDDFKIITVEDYFAPAVKTPCLAAAGRSGFRRFI